MPTREEEGREGFPQARPRDVLMEKARREIIMALGRYDLTASEALALLTDMAARRARDARRPPRPPKP